MSRQTVLFLYYPTMLTHSIHSHWELKFLPCDAVPPQFCFQKEKKLDCWYGSFLLVGSSGELMWLMLFSLFLQWKESSDFIYLFF